ncbi:SRPBCC family protein [Labrys neptuniae]
MLQPIDLRIERRIAASIGTVWACLTTPALIADWFFAVDFRPEVGHRFRIAGEPVSGWRGWTDVEVLELEPPRRMLWSFDCCAEAEASHVLFELEQKQDHVRLLLSHDGFVPALTRRLLDEGWSAYLTELAGLAQR